MYTIVISIIQYLKYHCRFILPKKYNSGEGGVKGCLGKCIEFPPQCKLLYLYTINNKSVNIFFYIPLSVCQILLPVIPISLWVFCHVKQY